MFCGPDGRTWSWAPAEPRPPETPQAAVGAGVPTFTPVRPQEVHSSQRLHEGRLRGPRQAGRWCLTEEKRSGDVQHAETLMREGKSATCRGSSSRLCWPSPCGAANASRFLLLARPNSRHRRILPEAGQPGSLVLTASCRRSVGRSRGRPCSRVHRWSETESHKKKK